MKHRWLMTRSGYGPTEWQCDLYRGCRLVAYTPNGAPNDSPKLLAVPGPDRGLPVPGPEAPETCEESLALLAVWGVMRS